MHLVQTISPEGEQPAVLVPAEVCEVSEQAVCKLLVAGGAGAPGFGQHGVVGPVVADALLTEQVLAAGAGGVAPAPLLAAGELALGVGQLQEHRPCRDRQQHLSPAGSAPGAAS